MRDGGEGAMENFGVVVHVVAAMMGDGGGGGGHT